MDLQQFIEAAIQEDIREGDHTSLACIPEGQQAAAQIVAKDIGILAGIDIAYGIFMTIDPDLEVRELVRDGTSIQNGERVLEVSGKARSILSAERLVLNCMQRMSGIATLTALYVRETEGYHATILDTRKTTPLFRHFEKLAVKIGGGENHRFGLYDMIMIKDNHISYCGGIQQAIEAVQKYQQEKGLSLKVEIETANLKQVREVLKVGGVDRIMLDNFNPARAREAVRLIDGRYETEISGNVSLQTVREFAASGVDYISVGALTHSVRSLDLSMKAL